MNELRRFFVMRVLIVFLVATAPLQAMHNAKASEDEEKQTADRPEPFVSQLGIDLLVAVDTGDVAFIKRALQEGLGVNAANETGSTLLLRAASIGQTDVMQLLLERNAGVDIGNKHLVTPLMAAVQGGYTEAARMLLTHKGNVNAQDEGGTGTLHRAVLKGRNFLVSLLLGHRANVVLEDSKGYQSSHMAASKGNLPVIDTLLAAKAPIDGQNKEGLTVLAMAAANGRDSIVTKLLEKKAVVDLQNEPGNTPLIAAAKMGHSSTVALLLAGKARVGIKRKDGIDALTCAAIAGHQGVVNLLLKYKADIEAKSVNLTTPLLGAASRWHTSVVELLLNKKANVKATGVNGMTALVRAADISDERVTLVLRANGVEVNTLEAEQKAAAVKSAKEQCREVVRLLLANKARVHAVDANGVTPLMKASSEGDLPLVNMLLAHKADVNNDMHNKNTPLRRSVMNGHNAVASRLLKAKAAVDDVPEAVMTPLMIAAGLRDVGNKILVQELISYKADVDAVGSNLKCTPLVQAVAQKDASITELLLNSKARVDIMVDKMSILHHASIRGRAENVQLLIERGVNIHVEDAQHKTALRKAFDRGHIDVITMLVFFGADPSIIAADIEIETELNKDSGSVELSIGAAAAALINVTPDELYGKQVTWNAQKLEKLKKDMANAQIARHMLGQQNWLPEALLESHILGSYLPEDLEKSVDDYATQYASNNHDTLVNRLVREHIQRVQWLQARKIDFSPAGSYEPVAVLRLAFAEKQKIKESEEKEDGSEVVTRAQEYRQSSALGLVRHVSYAFASLRNLFSRS